MTKVNRLVFSIVCFIVVFPLFLTAYTDAELVQTFQDQDGNSIDRVLVPGRPPADYRVPAVELPEPGSREGIKILSHMPAFNWCYGCSATSAAMIAGYYDNHGYDNMYSGPANGGIVPMDNSVWGYGECPLSATHQGFDGLTARGHVDDYWYNYDSTIDPYYGHWTQHGYADCTADFMGTNQYQNYGNTDGLTMFYYYSNGNRLYDYSGCEPSDKDGCHGLREFFESRGYSMGSYANYNQYIYGHNGNTAGFTFSNFMEEIDAGRPVLIHITGHTMVGFGYNETEELVYIHDTWDHDNHTMTWGGQYCGSQHIAVSAFILDPIPGIVEPDVPGNTMIETQGGNIVLSWDDSGADAYHVYASERIDFSSPILMTNQGTFSSNGGRISWTTSAAISERLFFRVTAENLEGIQEDFVYVPAGSFQMGRTGVAVPVHTVNLDAFYVGKCEVTHQQVIDVYNWAYQHGYISCSTSTVTNTQGIQKELLDLNDSSCAIDWSGGQLVFNDNSYVSSTQCPCIRITWYGALAYCNFLSLYEGLTPCYNMSNWSCNWNANGYRLPTEAEWEYSARGATNNPDYTYAGNNNINYVAWYSSNSSSQTHPVGQLLENGIGTFDQSGNVYEWVWDWWSSDYYSNSPTNNPTGPSSGTQRIVRGGCWEFNSSNCDVAYRNSRGEPEYSERKVGFRIVRNAE